MVPYVDIIVICHSVAIVAEIYVMRHKYNERWKNFNFKRMLITGLCLSFPQNLNRAYVCIDILK